MSLDAPRGSSGRENECLHCGAYVSDRFCRVHGDNDDEVHRCPECDCRARINLGSAAGRSVGYAERLSSNGRDRGRSQREYPVATNGGGDA